MNIIIIYQIEYDFENIRIKSNHKLRINVRINCSLVKFQLIPSRRGKFQLIPSHRGKFWGRPGKVVGCFPPSLGNLANINDTR